VLTTVRWGAVLLALGVGVLVLAGSALILWLALSLIGVDGAAGAATTFGTLFGFAAAGWIAGRRAAVSHVFHGGIAALGVALAVIVTAVLGGSPAPTPQVLLLAFLAIVIGGLTAWLARR
jgi:hypothetical protein